MMIGHGTVSRFKDLWERGGHLPIRELSVSPTVYPLTVNIRLILEPGLEFTFDYEPPRCYLTDDIAWHLYAAIVKETTPA